MLKVKPVGKLTSHAVRQVDSEIAETYVSVENNQLV